MSKLSPQLESIRLKYDLEAADFWELPQRKGTWIVKHAALEAIAGMEGIQFDAPQIIEADTKNGVAVMSVVGRLTNATTVISTWATGEAAPGNNKNQYPWAMAEKRAKDRVVLKLTGIEAYSEDEADDFKQNARQSPTDASGEASGELDDGLSRKLFPTVQSDLMGCSTSKQLEGSWARWLPLTVQFSPLMQENVHGVYDQMRGRLAEHSGDARAADADIIEADLRIALSIDSLKEKWSGWGDAMRKLGPEDVIKLNGVKDEMKRAIEKAGGTMPDFNSLSRVAANPNLTPEEEHAVRVAQTP